MPWQITWSTDAARFVSSLEKPIAQRIMAKLDASAVEPSQYFTKLIGCDDYKLRVGDYRILALLLHSQKTIFIEKIGHRKNVYK